MVTVHPSSEYTQHRLKHQVRACADGMCAAAPPPRIPDEKQVPRSGVILVLSHAHSMSQWRHMQSGCEPSWVCAPGLEGQPVQHAFMPCLYLDEYGTCISAQRVTSACCHLRTTCCIKPSFALILIKAALNCTIIHDSSLFDDLHSLIHQVNAAAG